MSPLASVHRPSAPRACNLVWCGVAWCDVTFVCTTPCFFLLSSSLQRGVVWRCMVRCDRCTQPFLSIPFHFSAFRIPIIASVVSSYCSRACNVVWWSVVECGAMKRAQCSVEWCCVLLCSVMSCRVFPVESCHAVRQHLCGVIAR